MITQTKKVFAVAALIVATGVAAVELTRDQAQADPRMVTASSASYASARVDAAFEVVSAMPAMPAVSVPMAQKGDLQIPAGCFGADEAECMDVAYETESEPSLVVETRIANNSILMRLDALTLAVVGDEVQPQSE